MGKEKDQTFELMTLMYSTMQEQFANMNQYMNQRFDRIEQDMARMEFELKEQISILHDGVKANTESIDRLTVRMEILEKKVEQHEVKLRIVK